MRVCGCACAVCLSPRTDPRAVAWQRLVPGMKLLGAVRNVRKTTATLSLVGGHSATVMLEDISAPLVAAASQPGNATPVRALALAHCTTHTTQMFTPPWACCDTVLHV